MGKFFKILSIDGGGIRGVYSAHVLKCIEERLEVSLFDVFDMIAGTSTGSIIAAGIASQEPASSIVEFYKKHGFEIFPPKWYARLCETAKKYLSMCESMCRSPYDFHHLERALINVFQDKRLGDIDKPLLIPSTDITNGCVHVLKSAYSNDFTRDKNVLVKDAVLASCSAPMFFDPHKLDHYLLADGGLWANNPALAAMIDAQKRLNIHQDDIRILSIGTGHSRKMFGSNPSRKWGFLNGWRKKEFIEFILSLQSQSALNYLKLMLRSEQIMRIDFDSDTSLPLDDASQIDNLIAKADHDFTHESKRIMEFILDGGVES